MADVSFKDCWSISSNLDSSFLLCHMSESTYAKVIFCDVRDSYSAESDVECLYQLSESVVPHPDDCIGLFCVAWRDLSQCIISVPCSSASRISSLAGDSYNKVIFKVKDLPRDDLEYYQFLYLTKDCEICGASTPFKLHTANKSENAVVLCAEHDFVEVKSSNSVLQNQLADMQKHVTFLEKEKKELENKIATMEKEKEEAIAQVEEEKRSIQKALSDTKDLFHASEERKKLVCQELENVKKSKDEMASSMEDMKLFNSSLKEQLENAESAKRYVEKVWELEEAKSSFASEKESWDKHCGELEQQIDNLTIRLKEATILQDQKDKLCSKLVQQTDDLVERLEEAAKLYKKQLFKIKTLKKALKSKSFKRKYSPDGAVDSTGDSCSSTDSEDSDTSSSSSEQVH